ncbi:MAG TPA: site-2 protease family protein [Micromonosporaceae bacterium]
MMETLGIVVFALGIVVSLALHEAGHMWSARAFGMKVTRFFIGFGPTLFAFRRKGIEYGVKAIPAGAFVKIVGMTPQDDDVEPGDEARAMWRFPVWKRTIVLASGAFTHFVLGMVILWLVFAFVALPRPERLDHGPVTIEQVAACTEPSVVYDPTTRGVKPCVVGTDPQSVASAMGLVPGDVIVAVDGQAVDGWEWLTTKVRAAGGQQITVTVQRGDQTLTRTGTLPTVLRLKQEVLTSDRALSSITDADLEPVGVLGVTPVTPTAAYGAGAAFRMTWDNTVGVFKGVVASIGRFPERVPQLWSALWGAPRDPETPISVVGASRIGGEWFSQGQIPSFLFFLAALNFFVGVFNLLPLLPLDGGHILVAWFEKVRRWIYARLRRPDPGTVDYAKLMPITYAVIIFFGALSLLTVAADIVNPITIPK